MTALTSNQKYSSVRVNPVWDKTKKIGLSVILNI